jgi:hypothetical protein
VDEIMTKILFENEDDEDEEVINASKMLKLFHVVHNDEEEILYYTGRVSSAFQYIMARKYGGEGLSFRQAARVMYHTFTVGGLSKLGKLNRKLVSDLMRLCCVESLQVISHALQSSWAFFIALDGGTKASTPYLDFRVRFVLKSNLYNLHLFAAPIYQANEYHTSLASISVEGILHYFKRLERIINHFVIIFKYTILKPSFFPILS